MKTDKLMYELPGIIGAIVGLVLFEYYPVDPWPVIAICLAYLFLSRLK